MTGVCELTEKHSKVRLHLPLELHCELLSALPFEHAARLLLLSKAIAKNCNSLVQKQRKGWKVFSENCIDKIMKVYHPLVSPTLKSIEEEHHSLEHSEAHQQDTFLNKHIQDSRAELSFFVGANLVRRLAKCETAGQVMTELLNSVVNMHHFIETFKKRMKEMDERFNEVKRLADRIKSDFVPRDIPSQMFPTATVWSAERLRRDYTDHLRALRVRLRETKRNYRKKLNQIGVCKQINEWYGELKMHRRIILDQWRALLKQKSTEFDVSVWCAQMLSELEANNALTI